MPDVLGPIGGGLLSTGVSNKCFGSRSASVRLPPSVAAAAAVAHAGRVGLFLGGWTLNPVVF